MDGRISTSPIPSSSLASGSRSFFHGGHDWKEKVAGGWSISGILTFHSGYGWTPVYTAPHQIYCNPCNYGFQNLRPCYNGRALRNTSNSAFKTGSNFPNPGTANTGTNNDQFINNYFTVPNYANAIADNPGQFATAFIPPPGIGRNAFPGPGYRDVDLNLAKAFGLPRIPVIGENAKIEIKANFLNVFNTLNINPSTFRLTLQMATSARRQARSDRESSTSRPASASDFSYRVRRKAHPLPRKTHTRSFPSAFRGYQNSSSGVSSVTKISVVLYSPRLLLVVSGSFSAGPSACRAGTDRN